MGSEIKKAVDAGFLVRARADSDYSDNAVFRPDFYYLAAVIVDQLGNNDRLLTSEEILYFANAVAGKFYF